MGERYDVIVEANNPGVWQIAAAPEDKSGIARAVLRYGESRPSSPPPAITPSRKNSRAKLLSYGDLRTTMQDVFPSDGYSEGPIAH